MQQMSSEWTLCGMCSSSRTFYSSPSPYVVTKKDFKKAVKKEESKILKKIAKKEAKEEAKEHAKRHDECLQLSKADCDDSKVCEIVTHKGESHCHAKPALEFAEDEEGIYIMSPGETRAKKIAGLPVCKGSEDYKNGCYWTTDRDENGRCKKMVCPEAEAEDEDEEGIYITPNQARQRVAALPLCPSDYDLDEIFKMGHGKIRCAYTTDVDENGHRCKKLKCD